MRETESWRESGKWTNVGDWTRHIDSGREGRRVYERYRGCTSWARENRLTDI